MKWYGIPATAKQLEFIELIEDRCGRPWFKGKSKQEASEYISSRIDSFRARAEVDYDIWSARELQEYDPPEPISNGGSGFYY